MKKKHHCRPGSKRFAECHEAALEIIERLDDDITPETIYWRALFERCKRFAAMASEDPPEHIKMNAGIGRIRECRTGDLVSRASKVLRSN